jgi:hypothetical protein
MLLLAVNAESKNVAFEKLCDLNSYWRQHKVDFSAKVVTTLTDETSWIVVHLRLVEAALRQANTKGLSSEQILHRRQCLDHLNEYWHARLFPVNEDYPYRTPIFIDRHDNFCAVGYLIKTSGREALARYISANSNLAYVKQMAYPELKAWAIENGFTVDELAWIQPGYGYARSLNPVGKGLDGSVYELFPDTADGKLYVGGRFAYANDTIATGNIAFVTSVGAVFNWHSMGTIDSTVYAITRYKTKIIAAGSSVYSWNDTAWMQLGCVHGRIRDLAVVNGQLCAAGLFDTCGGPASNFAIWNDTSWQPVSGLTGIVNTLEVMDTTLVLGGGFSYNGIPLNAIKWSRNAGFVPFTNGIANEVNDFEVQNGTLYAVCKKTDPSKDSLEIAIRLVNNQWTPFPYNTFGYFFPVNGTSVSIRAVCYEGKQLLVGGNFWNRASGSSRNCYVIPPAMVITPTYFSVNSAVNKIAVFKDNVFIGGDFDSSYPYIYTPTLVKHIGWAPVYGASTIGITPVPASGDLVFYPNPVISRGAITIKANFRVDRYSVYDLTGRVVDEGQPQVSGRIVLPDIAPGLYLLEVRSAQGNCLYCRLEVQ